MKKTGILLAAIGSACIFSAADAQKKTTTKKTITHSSISKSSKGSSTGILLKDDTDSLSYAIGISMAKFYKEQGVESLNVAVIDRAIKDGMTAGAKPILSEQDANQVMMNAQQRLAGKQAAKQIADGSAFLAKNKLVPGIVELPSGLQYKIITPGNGPKPTDTSTVKVHYKGTLIDGTVFDSSIDRGEPITFPVNGVIAGWTEALKLMPVGSKWQLFIPSKLAYGNRAAGPVIKPGSTLIFDVELLSIEK